MKLRRSACVLLLVAAGCGRGSATSPDPVPAPTPAPTPVPTPTPAPTPTPGEAPVTNTSPPVRLTIKVYKVTDKNEVLQPLTERDPIPVGYKVTIDATAKDAEERETNGVSGWVAFEVSDTDLVDVGGNHAFQRKLVAKKAGRVEVWAVLDGVQSNTLSIRFVEP